MNEKDILKLEGEEFFKAFWGKMCFEDVLKLAVVFALVGLIGKMKYEERRCDHDSS